MLEEDTAAVEDNIVDEAIDALEGEELENDAPDYSDLEQDKLIEELKRRDEEVAKAKKSYTEYRSMSDRKETEFRERLAKLEGMLESAQTAKPADQPADYSDIIKEMEDAIEDDPKNAAKYLVQFAQEFQATMGEQSQTLESKFQSRLAQESAVYKNNKDFVDKCVERGMSLTDAIEFVSEVKGAESRVAQPGTPKAPGVVEAGRAASSKPEVPKVNISPTDLRIFKAMGLTDKEIQEAAREAAKDMVNG